MQAAQSYPWFHGDRYSSHAACEHCNSAIGHEAWCIARDAAVRNAFQAVLDSAKLALHDHLILHALEASWEDLCAGECTS
jgi:hypothetical protein